MFRNKYLTVLIFIILTIFPFTMVYAKETIYRPAMFTLGKYFQSNDINIYPEDLKNTKIYAEVVLNSRGKMLEEYFYVDGVNVARRMYSPRSHTILREEYYEWDSDGNKMIYEIKNYYGKKNTFRSKAITSVVKENKKGKKSGVYVKYELFSNINDTECKRLEQLYEEGKLKHVRVFYYDEDATLIIVEERNADNALLKIGRVDLSRLMVGTGDISESILWRDID